MESIMKDSMEAISLNQVSMDPAADGADTAGGNLLTNFNYSNINADLKEYISSIDGSNDVNI